MSVQTLFDYSRNGPPVILPRVLPAAWQPASSAGDITIANINVESINDNIYKSKTTSVSDLNSFAVGGATTSIILANGMTFDNNNWTIAVMPTALIQGATPWAEVTGPNTFNCASGVDAGDTSSYAFIYIATGIIGAEIPEPAPLSAEFIVKKAPLWYQ